MQCISVRENEIAADAMGINTTYYKVVAFAIGSFFAGVAGACIHITFILFNQVNFGFLKSFDILIFVVLRWFGKFIRGSTCGNIINNCFYISYKDILKLV